MPSDKICEKLMKKDPQICDLRYGKVSILWTFANFNLLFKLTEKTIDLKTVDLKKLRVKDLKKILSDWDEVCDGCIEKAEFITRIELLKPKYVREELWAQTLWKRKHI